MTVQCTVVVNYFLLVCLVIFVDYYDRKIGVMFLLFAVAFCYVRINVNLKFTANILTYRFVLVL